MKTTVKSPESADYRRGLGIFLTETPPTDTPKHLFRPLFPRNPHFPALRSDPMAPSGASRRKQPPSSQRSGMRGIKVGLVGLISNDNAKSAYGYRLELDSAWTAMTNIPGSKVEGIGVYCKGLKIGSSGDEVPGSSDIDVFLRISDERLAVQTKISASADHVAKLPNWIRVATSADNIPGGQLCPDGAGMRDRLLKCRFYFDFDGRSSSDVVNDVASVLMRDASIGKAFRQGGVSELISFINTHGLVSDILK